MKLSPIQIVVGLTSILAVKPQGDRSNLRPPVDLTTPQAGDLFLQNLLHTAGPLPTIDLVHPRQSTLAEFSTAGVVGEIIALPFDTVPAGYLECNGQAVSRDDYPELYEMIGKQYGLGTEINTFKVPDYRGNFLRGWDHGKGLDPDRSSRMDRGDGTIGDYVGTRQNDAFQGFKQEIASTSVSTGWQNSDSQILGHQGHNAYGPTYRFYTGNIADDGHGIPRVSFETRPNNINIIYAIRAKPISIPTPSVTTKTICDETGASCFTSQDIAQLVASNQAMASEIKALQANVRDLQNVYQIIDESAAKTMQATQDNQADQLDQHQIWLLCLSVACGLQLTGLLIILYKQPSPQSIQENQKSVSRSPEGSQSHGVITEESRAVVVYRSESLHKTNASRRSFRENSDNAEAY